MLKYIVKKLIIGVLTLFLVATLIFFMLRFLPKDYYFSEEELVKLTEQQKDAVLTAAGLNDPIPDQLMRFYRDIIHLDFGVSNKIQKGISVSYLIFDRMKISLKLGIISLVISLVLGVFIGVIQTLYKEPNMILIQAVKGGKPRITVEKPLIVYDKPGEYSAEMRENYGY